MLEVEDDILSEVIGCKGYHKRASRYGERAWIAEGEEIDVVYWDEGNGWCMIMQVIPKGYKKECMEKGIKFYRKLKKAMKKSYEDEIDEID